MNAHPILFMVSLWFVTCLSGLVSAGAKDELRSAMSALDAELKQNADRRELWRSTLKIGELEKLLETPDSEIGEREVASQRIKYLATEVPPNEQLLLKARDSIGTWLDNDNPEREAELRELANDSLNQLYRSFTKTPRKYWDQVLGIRDMLTEFRKYENADKETVRDLHVRLVAEASATDRSRFEAVRRAIGRWNVELREPLTDELAIAARNAKSDFRPVETWRADQALNYLQERLRLLDMYFSLDADWKREGWEEFLQLETLHQEIDQPRDARYGVLRDSLGLFDSGVLGLQRPPFRNTRDALEKYIVLLRMSEGTPSRLIETRQRLQVGLELLDQYLVAGGERKERGWKQFLQWNDLEAELKKQNPDPRTLNGFLKKFEAEEEGLEALPFRLVARRLGKYMEMREFMRTTRKPIDFFDGQLDKLARLLESHGKEPKALTAADISATTEWLTATGLATDLVQRVQARYSHNNVFGSISGQLISDQLRDALTDKQTINRMLDGAHVRGTAHTRAYVSGRLVPSPNMAVLDVLMNGRTSISTVGQQRRVSVYSTGTTHLSGQKRLFFDLNQGLSTVPAVAAAQTQQQINGVNVNRILGRHLIAKFARKKARQTIPKAKWLANSEARQTVTKQMDERAAPLVEKANEVLQEQVKSPLRERGFRPEMFQISSTSSHVEMQAKLTPTDYFGAPSGPPVWNRDDDLAICIHESAINNSLASFFGGMRLDNENILQILDLYGLEIPETLKPDADGETEYWSMTFDLHHPISVSIGVNRIHIRFMGSQFEQGNSAQNQRIRVGAMYKVNWHRKKLPDIERQGEVEVEFVDMGPDDRLSTRQVAAKTFILGKVGGVLEPKIDLNDFDISALQPVLDAVTLNRASLYKGWLAATLDVDPDALPKDLELPTLPKK